MDAERRIIPIVEDDQGEGMMDPLDILDLEKEERKNDLEKMLDKIAKRLVQSQHENNTGRK